MDKEFEARICKSFFNKQSRDRIYYELSTPKKRQEFFRRMSHTPENYLSDCIAIRFKMPPSPEEITEFLSPGKCYFIADNDLDGKLLDPAAALPRLYRREDTYMAVNADCTLAYLETEYNFSEHFAYFLKTRKDQ